MNILETIREFNRINFEIDKLKKYKEELERSIIEETGRATFYREEETGKIRMLSLQNEGKKTHKIGKYDVEITTDYIYKINKDVYAQSMERLKAVPTFIKEEIKLNLDKRQYKAFMEYAPEEIRTYANELVTFEPAKPHVKVIDTALPEEKAIEFEGF